LNSAPFQSSQQSLSFPQRLHQPLISIDPTTLLNAFLSLFALLIAVIGILVAEYHSAKNANLGGSPLTAYRWTARSLVLSLFLIGASSLGLVEFGGSAVGWAITVLLVVVFFLAILMAYVVYRFMN